jgi:hypothetical protein
VDVILACRSGMKNGFVLRPVVLVVICCNFDCNTNEKKTLK